MSWSAVVTMLVVTGVIWGGFSLALLTAIRGERRRNRTDAASDEPGADDRRSPSDEVR
jgi:hypothetical protein